MSLPAMAARPPAGAGTAHAGAASSGATAGAGAPDDGGNAFAALLAGLGEVALAAAPAAEDMQAVPGALPQDAAEAAGDPAAGAAAPNPLAGMALLMAQYTAVVAPGAMPPGTAPPGADGTGAGGAPLAASAAAAASAGSCAAVTTALPATVPGTSPTATGLAAGKAASAALQGADLSGATVPARPDPIAQATLTPLPALATDAAPGQAAGDVQPALQALPDMASLTAGWATAPVPTGAQGPAATAPVYQAELPSRPGDAAFTGDLAAQVTVLVEGGFQQAELRLNPADLGPIQIQLSVSAQTQTADISFSAVHSLTRESIEQALPALRDMLQSQGLSLGQAGVSGGQQQAGDGRDGAAAQARPARPGAQGADNPPAPGALQGLAGSGRATRGMLDLYA